MNKKEMVSRRAAAKMLGVTPSLMDPIAAKNKLRTFQIPGHSRTYYFRKEIEELNKRSATKAGN